MRHLIVRRQRELLATTLVTTVLFAASFAGVLSSAPASADTATDVATTVAPTTTAGAPATQADSPAVPAQVVTTTTEAPTTTVEPTTTTTVVVEGKSTYATDCKNTLLPDADPDHFSFVVTANAFSPVETGSNLVITNQHWTVTVPAATADLIRGLGVTGVLNSNVTVTIAGTNVSPGFITSAPIATSIDFGGTGDATGSFDVPDMTFIPTGGTATFTLDALLGISTQVDLPIGDPGPTPVTLTCLPTSGPAFLSVDVFGAALPTTIVSRGTTTLPPAANNLPVTGPNNHTLWTEVLAGLLLIQVGLLAVAVSRRSRRTA